MASLLVQGRAVVLGVSVALAATACTLGDGAGRSSSASGVPSDDADAAPETHAELPDATPSPDASTCDGSADAMRVGTDAAIDASADAGTASADAAGDAGADAAIDAGADAPIDAGADAPIDAGADAPIDSGTDAGSADFSPPQNLLGDITIQLQCQHAVAPPGNVPPSRIGCPPQTLDTFAVTFTVNAVPGQVVSTSANNGYLPHVVQAFSQRPVSQSATSYSVSATGGVPVDHWTANATLSIANGRFHLVTSEMRIYPAGCGILQTTTETTDCTGDSP